MSIAMHRRAALIGLFAIAASCRFDRSDRWVAVETAQVQACVVGDYRCGEGVETCVTTADGARWQVVQQCAQMGLVCDPSRRACVSCQSGSRRCDGATVTECNAAGEAYEPVAACDEAEGLVCRGGGCINLCAEANKTKSNVGCEYWAVDLDNASLGASNNAAGQQFAVVISNVGDDIAATVRITQDDALPGEPPSERVVVESTVPPRTLQVFKLGPREVDGSPDGQFDTGTGTALTRHAYKITTSAPVVAYQFNPLENANVFSNDASLLKPVAALGQKTTTGEPEPAYVVVGWPQTIAVTDDPNTNFDPTGMTQLRAFLTVVGTRPGTKVRVVPATDVIAGAPIAATKAGEPIEVTLDAHDVLNLETGGFNADFTGSLIEASDAVVVFSGSEASDAPTFRVLSERFCCADHLEEQLDPIRTAGTYFVASHGPSRTRAVVAAGGQVAEVEEPDYFRPVAVREGETRIITSLPPPHSEIVLKGRGDFVTIEAKRDFMLAASQPIVLGNVSASQEAAGIRRGLPGGDPSLLVVPPVEQYRASYVFLTPDKYAFDFVNVIAPPGVSVKLDGAVLDEERCEVAAADGLTKEQRGSDVAPFVVYRCQLSFPVIDPSKDSPDNLSVGQQDDGVHRVVADVPVGVIVSGFDAFVSYAYAAGTDLRELEIK